MQFEVLPKAGQTHKTLEGRLLHLFHIAEAHVITNQGQHLLGNFIRESQASANLFCHARSNLGMMVKSNAVRSNAKRRWLADIVQKHSPCQGPGASLLKSLEEQKGVDPNVTFGVILWRLLDAFHCADFRQKLGQQPALIEQLKAEAGASFGEHLVDFITDALTADLMNIARQPANRSHGTGFDFITKPRGES